jgi:hypothetical protein
MLTTQALEFRTTTRSCPHHPTMHTWGHRNISVSSEEFTNQRTPLQTQLNPLCQVPGASSNRILPSNEASAAGDALHSGTGDGRCHRHVREPMIVLFLLGRAARG